MYSYKGSVQKWPGAVTKLLINWHSNKVHYCTFFTATVRTLNVRTGSVHVFMCTYLLYIYMYNCIWIYIHLYIYSYTHRCQIAFIFMLQRYLLLAQIYTPEFKGTVSRNLNICFIGFVCWQSAMYIFQKYLLLVQLNPLVKGTVHRQLTGVESGTNL